MKGVTFADFESYFRELHGHPPYPWQRRLAARAVEGDWPGAIDLPTASGKTACIDIAVFALACQASRPVETRTAPRRVFFCVNRRVIVDEAHQRARRIAGWIRQAEAGEAADKPILGRLAASLRQIAGTRTGDAGPPLDVLELRGGIERDNRWARSITQPTIVCTTLDQIGSRLLFRGYGVSPGAAPIQAALIAYDSLILLDEAHISQPFRQTLDHVERYLDPQKWAERTPGVRPVVVVPMTATPSDAMRQRGVITLEADDRDPGLALHRRLSAGKPAVLRQVRDVADGAISAAVERAQPGPAAVGIIVNRVATARTIYDRLRGMQREPGDRKRRIPADARVELVIGSMRPIDRDRQADRLRTLVGPDRPLETTEPGFVVATQCLEVGADYDFDVLITECASLDALRQRFGRLNRAGRAIEARGVILAHQKDIRPEDQLDDSTPLDPIYGNALARTWHWLNAHATEGWIDFGVDALDALLGPDGPCPESLRSPSALLNAPVMLPAYVDFWCQTAPRPVPDPDVSLFIHGPRRGEPDVQVCWRADLIEDDGISRQQWCEVVALLPPTAAECMSVPMSRVRRWLADQRDQAGDHGDVLGVGEADAQGRGRDDGRSSSPVHPGVLWRGVRDSRLIRSPDDLRPGDTLVLPASAVDSRGLGHLPDTEDARPQATGDSHDPPRVTAINDAAESAFTRARDLTALRLHPALRSRLSGSKVVDALFASAADRDEPPARSEWSTLLGAAAEAMPNDDSHQKEMLRHLADTGFQIEPYPDNRGVVLIGRQPLGSSTDCFVPSLDDGDDERSRSRRGRCIRLDRHTDHVVAATKATLDHLALTAFADVCLRAARLHDLGKADERFQAMLRRTDRTDAWLLTGDLPALLAKSDGIPATPAQRDAARRRAGLPAGFRHEMLSVQLAEWSADLPGDADARELLLHLIAAHHGHARPLAPVVVDQEWPGVEVHGVCLSHEERSTLIPAHRLDSGIAERFWRLTRRFGWWGLAYLEAVLRLADQQASAAEETGEYDPERIDPTTETAP